MHKTATPPRRDRSDVVRLRLGQHVCLFYRNPGEQMAAVVPYIREGLRRRERCLYLANDRTLDEVRAALTTDGIDVRAEERRRALLLRQSGEVYLRSGAFVPEEMVRLLGDAVREALADGFTGLRASGEMTWALGEQPGCDRLIEYEGLLNRFYGTHPALGLCQYNVHRFPAAIVHGALRTHQQVLFDGRLRQNPFAGSHVDSINWMLAQL
jgi:hypothetical protein